MREALLDGLQTHFYAGDPPRDLLERGLDVDHGLGALGIVPEARLLPAYIRCGRPGVGRLVLLQDRAGASWRVVGALPARPGGWARGGRASALRTSLSRRRWPVATVSAFAVETDLQTAPERSRLLRSSGALIAMPQDGAPRSSRAPEARRGPPRQKGGTMIMRRRWIVAAVVATSAVVAGTALATDPSGQTVTLLSRAHKAGTLNARADGVQVRRFGGSADVAVLSVSFAPGGSSGWHHHPGVGLVAVQSGVLTFYDENCNKQTFKAGQAFVEKGSRPRLVRNNGSTRARVYATFVIPSRTPTTGLRVDDPQPSGCGVR